MLTANRWPRMTELARTFPCFAPGGAKDFTPGLEPFDPELFSDHVDGYSHGEYCAAKFLLFVFSGEPWQGRAFDLGEALGVWDDEYRQAFIAWVADPWWP